MLFIMDNSKKFLFVLFLFFFSSSAKCDDVKIKTTSQYGIFVSPLTFLVGGTTFGLDSPISEKWTLGVEFTHYSFANNSYTDAVKISNTSYGLRAMWFPTVVFGEGEFYILKTLKVISSVNLTTASGNLSNHFSQSFSTLFGYGRNWKWRDFFLLLSGGGVISQVSKTEFLNTEQVVDKSYNNLPVGIFIDFNVVYLF